MRGLVPAVAAVGVLLIGGLPALAITLASQDAARAPVAAASPSPSPSSNSGPDEQHQPGRPGHRRGHPHGHAYGHAHAPGWLKHHGPAGTPRHHGPRY